MQVYWNSSVSEPCEPLSQLWYRTEQKEGSKQLKFIVTHRCVATPHLILKTLPFFWFPNYSRFPFQSSHLKTAIKTGTETKRFPLRTFHSKERFRGLIDKFVLISSLFSVLDVNLFLKNKVNSFERAHYSLSRAHHYLFFGDWLFQLCGFKKSPETCS